MSEAERLRLRCNLVQAHPDLNIKTWHGTRGIGTCPEGHDGLWALVDRGILLFCPGGTERKCYARLREIAFEIEQDLIAHGDNARLERMAKKQHVAPVLRLDVPWINEVWTDMHRRSVTENDITGLSPLPIPHEVEQHWRYMLSRLYRGPEVLWIGEAHETSSQEFATNFKTVDEWLARPRQITTNRGTRPFPAPGPLWCPGTFKTGTFYRREDCVAEQYLFGFEADHLPLAQQREVISWLIRNHWPIVAIIFSGNKSYHVVLLVAEGRLNPFFAQYKMTLKALGFDMQPFRVGGTVRLPGFDRIMTDEKTNITRQEWQRLIYINDEPLRDHEALIVAKCKRFEKPPGYYQAEGGYDEQSFKRDQRIRALTLWKIEEEKRGRVFGYSFSSGKPVPPAIVVREIIDADRSALRAKSLSNLLWKLAAAIERMPHLVNRKLHLGSDEMQLLADVLNRERLPRVCSGINDVETRKEVDESLRLWLSDDAAALIAERFGNEFRVHKFLKPKAKTIRLGRFRICYEPDCYSGYVTFSYGSPA